FKTTLDSGRTKIKNIELGKQRVSDDDLNRIAQCLEVPVQQLQPPPGSKTIEAASSTEGILLSQKVVEMFPELQEYLEMLQKAAVIDDVDLIEYLSKKIAGIWQDGPKTAAPSSKKTVKTT
ncbi:MAG: hypothetical protein PVG28_06100, partial [Desulfobacterales bacterium]